MYAERHHVARKPGTCEGCRGVIPRGERYLRIVGTNVDGDFGHSAYHQDCRDWEVQLNRYNGLGADDWTLLHEHVSEDGPGVLDEAPQAVRARFGLSGEADTEAEALRVARAHVDEHRALNVAWAHVVQEREWAREEGTSNGR